MYFVYIFFILVGIIAMCAALIFVCSPFFCHRDRQWRADQIHLPGVTITQDRVTITHFRDFIWKNNASHTNIKYRTINFSLHDIISSELVISYFSRIKAVAHVLIVFTLRSSDRICVSIEARRGSHERFSPFLGLLNRYDLIYIFGSDRDVLGLRRCRGELIVSHKTTLSPIQCRRFFSRLVERAQSVEHTPTFYHTFFQSCAYPLISDLCEDIPASAPVLLAAIAPGFLEKTLLKRGIIK